MQISLCRVFTARLSKFLFVVRVCTKLHNVLACFGTICVKIYHICLLNTILHFFVFHMTHTSTKGYTFPQNLALLLMLAFIVLVQSTFIATEDGGLPDKECRNINMRSFKSVDCYKISYVIAKLTLLLARHFYGHPKL